MQKKLIMILGRYNIQMHQPDFGELIPIQNKNP